MHRMKFLAHEHALHAPPRAIRSLHVLVTVLPRTWSGLRHAMSALGRRHSAHVNVLRHQLRQHTLAPRVISLRQPLTSLFLTVKLHSWLLTFDQKLKYFNRAYLAQFSLRFRIWAPFLHLRSLNSSLWSFSSWWLNKTNKTLFILS